MIDSVVQIGHLMILNNIIIINITNITDITNNTNTITITIIITRFGTPSTAKFDWSM